MSGKGGQHEFGPSPGTNGLSFGQSFERARRCFEIGKDIVFQPDAVVGMGLAVSSVVGLGIAEGLMLSRKGVSGRLRFALRYGVAQFLPSIIWYTRPPAMVLNKMRFDAKKILRPLEEMVLKEGTEGAQAADALVRINLVQTLRSIIAGFVGISQILRIMGIAGEANDQYTAGVLEGRQPIMSGVKERVIRLAGKDSDVTALSLERYGQHVVPIFEVPSLVRDLMERHSQGGRLPVFWCIPSGAYSLLSSVNRWHNFGLSSEWFIDNAAGEKVLVVEADSSVGEQSLALGIEQSNDLSIQEVGQGFVSIRALMERVVKDERITAPTRLVRVLLCDSNHPLVSGGGSTTCLRRYVERHDECDVLIDAKAPLLQAVEEWAQRVLMQLVANNTAARGIQTTSRGVRGTIVFDTHNKDYFRTMKRLLESRGWQVRDRPTEAALAKGGLPDSVWLVYEDSTVDTVHKMRTLVKNGHVSPANVCALLDKQEGMVQLKELSRELGLPDLSFVCSSLIYDNLFALVRQRVRSGSSNAEIQRELDSMLEKFVVEG